VKKVSENARGMPDKEQTCRPNDWILMSVCWDVSAEQRVGRMVSCMVPSAWESSAMFMSVCWEGGCSREGEAKREKQWDAKE